MPLLWLSLAFLSGVWLDQALELSEAMWRLGALVAAGLGVFRAVLARRFPGLPGFSVRLPNPDDFPASQLSIFLILGAFFLGGWRYQAAQPAWDAAFIASYNDLGVEANVQGVIEEPPQVRDQTIQMILETEKIRFVDEADGRAVNGLLLARLPIGGDWHYGDWVEVRGQLETPPEDESFSYQDYLAHHGIYSYMPYSAARLLERGQGNRLLRWLYNLRDAGLSSLYRLFPDPEASLLAGILLGVESNIPPAVMQAFQDSGVSHIIAISGFNIVIIAGLFMILFGRLLGRRRGAIAAIVAIGFYTLLVGAEASVVRAAIMSGLVVLSAQLGRRGNALNTLAIVAAVMAFFNPDILWDVGFQLTFMATLGLALYAGPLMAGFARLAERVMPPGAAQRLSRPVGEYFLFTFAALLPTLPVLVYTFNHLPLASLVANPLILPAQPAVMVLGGLAMLFGMIFQPLGQFIAYLAWPFVAYTIHMAEFWAQFRGAILHFDQVSGWAVITFYVLLFGVTFGLPAWRKHTLAAQAEGEAGEAPLGWREALRAGVQRAAVPLLGLTLAGLVVLASLTWRTAAAAPDGRLHVQILDVGSGDAVLIQTPTGRTLLIDGGASARILSDALGRRLPLGQRRLDFLIVAGIEDEQLGALPPVLERYPAGQVLWSGPTGGTRSARLLREFIAEEQIPLVEAQSGQSLDLGDGARLVILSANRRGAALLLEWNRFRALLPIGLEKTALAELQADPALSEMTAVLLADGGYAPLNPAEWLGRLRPQVALLSVAAGDRRNLPDRATLQVLEGYTLLRTDQNGWIELSTDGERLWVEAAR